GLDSWYVADCGKCDREERDFGGDGRFGDGEAAADRGAGARYRWAEVMRRSPVAITPRRRPPRTARRELGQPRPCPPTHRGASRSLAPHLPASLPRRPTVLRPLRFRLERDLLRGISP